MLNIMKHSNTHHTMQRHQRSMQGHWRTVRQHWRSAWLYRHSCRVSGDIGDCGVGMCNRVTNHGDTGTLYRTGMAHRYRKERKRKNVYSN